jgi:hypothetical protein
MQVPRPNSARVGLPLERASLRVIEVKLEASTDWEVGVDWGEEQLIANTRNSSSSRIDMTQYLDTYRIVLPPGS